MKKAVILIVTLILAAMQAWAYDFEYNGIYYNVIGSDEAEVTHGNNMYVGDVIIPSTASDGATTYNVTSIGDKAFYWCGITSVEIPNSVTNIGNFAFCLCCDLAFIEIPSSVTSIGEGVFSSCHGLFHIEIPNGITSIGDRAFYCCYCLVYIEIPNGVTSIGDYAFSRCEVLPSIEISNSVTSIGKRAFSDCYKLTAVTLLNPNPTDIQLGNDVFQGVDTHDITLIVPASSVDSYKAAPVWRDFNVQGAVGIEDIKATTTQLYPNPTTGRLFIKTQSDNTPQVRAFNLQGVLLQETQGNEIDLTNYPNGVYMIEVDGETSKVIKK